MLLWMILQVAAVQHPIATEPLTPDPVVNGKVSAKSVAEDPVDKVLASYRARTAISPDHIKPCAAGHGGAAGDIVVCSRDESARLPLPDERGPPDGPYRPVGEARADPGPPCPPTGCTGVNLLKVPIFLFRLARKLADPDR